MLLLKLVLTILNLELGATTYNGIEGGETKQRYGTHHHGDKLCSIVTSNGDGTLIRYNKGGEKWELEYDGDEFCVNKQNDN